MIEAAMDLVVQLRVFRARLPGRLQRALYDTAVEFWIANELSVEIINRPGVDGRAVRFSVPVTGAYVEFGLRFRGADDSITGAPVELDDSAVDDQVAS